MILQLDSILELSRKKHVPKTSQKLSYRRDWTCRDINSLEFFSKCFAAVLAVDSIIFVPFPAVPAEFLLNAKRLVNGSGNCFVHAAKASVFHLFTEFCMLG